MGFLKKTLLMALKLLQIISLQGKVLWVMFTQTTSQCAGSGSIQVAHKKRKLEHVSETYGPGDYAGSLRPRASNVQCKSPTAVPQNFIRASTIKLLDTYQRCGQKVSNPFRYVLPPIMLAFPSRKCVGINNCDHQIAYM